MLDDLLLVCAFVSFVFATFNATQRLNLTALGLAFWSASILLPRISP